MKLFAALVAVGILLGGCETTQPTVLTTTKYKVVIPSDSMYRCPNVNNLPDPDTLTDAQVADLLGRLSEANAECRASLDQIKVFLKKAKKTVEG